MLGPASVTLLTQWPQGLDRSCELIGWHAGTYRDRDAIGKAVVVRMPHSAMWLHFSATIKR